MTWLTEAADIYTAIIWPLVILSILMAAYRHEFTLFRCAAVVGAGQLFIDTWAQLMMTPDSPLPVWPLLGMYTAQAVAVTVLPASRVCYWLGAVFICGVVISIIHLCLPFSLATEWKYWGNNALLAWATVAVLCGGVAGEGGKRVVHYLWGRLAVMARHTLATGTR